VTGPGTCAGVVNPAVVVVEPAFKFTVVVSTLMFAVPMPVPVMVRVSPPVVNAVG